jgi:hypothetical protein
VTIEDGRPERPVAAASPLAFACDVSDAERPMLVARVNQELHFVYRDGSTRSVFGYDVPEASGLTGSQVIARGDFVAARAIVRPFASNDSFEAFAEMVVLDIDGEVLFHERRPFAYDGWGSDDRLHGRADGLFVSTLNEVKAELSLVTWGDETWSLPGKWIALSDPDGWGRIVARDYESNSTADLLFVDLHSQTSWPSAYVSDDDRASSLTQVPGGIAYLARNPSRLVFETADGATAAQMDVSLPGSGHASPSYRADGDWTLFEVHEPGPRRVIVAKPIAGSWREVTLAAPEGWAVPESTDAPAVDHEGRVLMVLERAGEVQLHRTVDGTTWEPLGVPVAQEGYDVDLVQAGGAAVLDGVWLANAQLIGPQGGEGIVLSRSDGAGSPTNPTYVDDVLSGDGRCLAYFRSASLHVIETATYADRDTQLLSETQGAEMAWIPLTE